ncbi:MAG TPA: response regulator [Vicinamibacterales bacterium]|jgi:DNA-binding response OmpR family regulator
MDARTILVVDDDVVSLSALLEILRDDGFRATGAATLEAALRLQAVFLFDLLIVDLRLGRANGLDLVARARHEQSTMPAIVLSGASDVTAEMEARLLGADYLAKPVAPAVLLALVRLRLNRVRSTAHPEPI